MQSMKYGLIFVEGLPGTGKSTLSEQIYKLLINKGISSELLLESNEKIPSNFCDIAAVPKSDFTGLSVNEAILKETTNYFFVNMKKCTKEAAKKLQQYDVGNEFNNFISSQEYTRCTLEWWQNWVEDNIKESVLVLDSAFLQCPINEMIFRGSSDSEVTSYIQAIAEIIRPFNPICIYLCRENAEEAIKFAKTVKGERWTKGVEEGLAQIGCPDLFERRFALESSLFSSIHSIACNIKDYDWSDAEVKIHEVVL